MGGVCDYRFAKFIIIIIISKGSNLWWATTTSGGHITDSTIATQGIYGVKMAGIKGCVLFLSHFLINNTCLEELSKIL